MNKTLEKQVPANGNSLAPHQGEMRLLQLKSAVYDTQRQIQYLSQVQLPELERQIDELTHKLRTPSGNGGASATS